MTTRITVSAHCTDDKEVEVQIIDNERMDISFIQSGETRDYHVWDSRVIKVREIPKVSQ